MGIFENFNQFLETRLEEFLRQNPNLQLQIILEQLEEQEKDSFKITQQLKIEKESLEKEILSLAEEIKLWHGRIDKAQAVKRFDLMQAAQEREAALLRQGNQVWGKMEGTKQRLIKSQELLAQIKEKKKEVQVKYSTTKTEPPKSSNSVNKGWQNFSNYKTHNSSSDPLEAEFKNLEIDDELDYLKRSGK